MLACGLAQHPRKAGRLAGLGPLERPSMEPAPRGSCGAGNVTTSNGTKAVSDLASEVASRIEARLDFLCSQSWNVPSHTSCWATKSFCCSPLASYSATSFVHS